MLANTSSKTSPAVQSNCILPATVTLIQLQPATTTAAAPIAPVLFSTLPVALSLFSPEQLLERVTFQQKLTVSTKSQDVTSSSHCSYSNRTSDITSCETSTTDESNLIVLALAAATHCQPMTSSSTTSVCNVANGCCQVSVVSDQAVTTATTDDNGNSQSYIKPPPSETTSVCSSNECGPSTTSVHRSLITSNHRSVLKQFYTTVASRPTRSNFDDLQVKTGLSKRVLQVWFQNARARDRQQLLKSSPKKQLRSVTGTCSIAVVANECDDAVWQQRCDVPIDLSVKQQLDKVQSSTSLQLVGQDCQALNLSLKLQEFSSKISSDNSQQQKGSYIEVTQDTGVSNSSQRFSCVY
jgi:hypothetical protein